MIEYDEDTLLADGFEDALIGFSEPQPGRPRLAVYDVDRCIAVLVDRDGMTPDEALEFLDFNTFGAWVGKHTPIFVSLGDRSG